MHLRCKSLTSFKSSIQNIYKSRTSENNKFFFLKRVMFLKLADDTRQKFPFFTHAAHGFLI